VPTTPYVGSNTPGCSSLNASFSRACWVKIWTRVHKHMHTVNVGDPHAARTRCVWRTLCIRLEVLSLQSASNSVKGARLVSRMKWAASIACATR